MAKSLCTVCKTEVNWGTPVCPLCGSVLEWLEGDDNDHLDALYPLWDETEASSAPWIHMASSVWLPILGVSVGIFLVVIGARQDFNFFPFLSGIGLAGVSVWWMWRTRT